MFFSARTLAEALSGSWKNGPADVSGVFTDTRAEGNGKLFVALKGERFDAHEFLDKAVESGAAALCVCRGAAVPDGIPVLEVEDTLKAYQALGAWHRRQMRDLKVAGVTGSVGKTSVKEMLRAILSSAAGGENVLATLDNTNNHVGVPQNLLRLQENHRFAVVEMGMNHRGEILPLTQMARPDTAVVNSIAPCHIEHLGSLEGIAREKGDIFKGVPETGTAVIPADLPQTPLLKEAAFPRKILLFGTGEGCDVRAAYLRGDLSGSSFELTFREAGTFRICWHLMGRHQAVNAAAAACCALSLGISPEVIVSALPRTVLPGMRSRITRLGGAVFINDSYNANPASMASSFDYLKEFADPRHLVLLLGGMLELGPESEAAHEKIAAAALELFPGAEILLFGAPFARTAARLELPFYEKAADAQETVASFIKPGNIIFAKGSNGIGMQNALPREAR